MFEKIKAKLLEDKVNIYAATLYYEDENGNSHIDGEIFHHVAGCTNIYSVSKNYTATAIGIACDKGLLSVNDSISDICKNDLPDGWDERWSKVKIHHLLNQTTGIKSGFMFENERYQYQNWLERCFKTPLDFAPGKQFTYSNSNAYMLSCAISRVSGMKLDMFLRKNMLEKLGFEAFAWERCPMDEPVGATGLFLYPKDFLRIGILYLHGGEGIVSEKWIHEATKNQVNNPDQPAYGYSFWIKDEGYELNGANGQIIRVFPERRMIFAAQGCNAYDYNSMLEKTIL